VLLLSATAGQALGAQETLVAAGSVWKYLDDGSDQGVAWTQPGFDDSAWASGPAELGYGDSDEATAVSYGPSGSNKYITTYFRHRFSVSDPAGYPKLQLRVRRDDGAVVYLNGVEVLRTNMPTGAITYTTAALSAVAGSGEREFIETTIDGTLLVAGENLLAVSVHQDRPSSSDLSFDLALGTPAATVPEQEPIVAAGSVWKYLDDGSDQGTAWSPPGFDDSTWPSGPAELGYGDGDEATGVSYGPNANDKYITTYFRHTFSVSDAASYPRLLLKVRRDDGAVVYLNGVELFRTNVPAGTITYTTTALDAVAGSEEREFVETIIDAAYLVVGENLLAVSVHQDRGSSSDLSFDLTLAGTTRQSGPGAPTVTTGPKGPYLFYPGDNTKMQVLWQLQSPASHTLRWGRDTTYAEGSVTPAIYGDNQYEHMIAGLTPGVKYYYQVEGLGAGSFLAAPAGDAAEVKFLVLGDTQNRPETQDRVNKAMIGVYTNDPGYQMLTIKTGDWTSNGERESVWTNEWFSRSHPSILEILANMPFNGCIGNHDGSGALFQKYWPYPWQNGGRYWSFDYGPAHFVMLDLTWEISVLGDTQRAWLEADLAASAKPWKFLVFHAPVYSAGGLHPNNPQEQAYIQSLCELYGVALVLNGHNHYYAHCEVNGVKHITTGGGGASLYPVDLSYDPSIVKAVSVHHFCKVNIHGTQLDFEAVGIDGTVIDAFTLDRPPLQ
jgi:hypothetical protein